MKPSPDSSLDVAKVLFDAFSKRVAGVEESIRNLNAELGRMRQSTERSQTSDLVLLERIQRTEGLLEQSLNWTKRLIEAIESQRRVVSEPSVSPAMAGRTNPIEVGQQIVIRPVVTPSGEAGSLSSITTPTELQVLSLLAERGAVSAPEIGRLVGRSREHTARLMKRLYQEGYVKRDQNRIPFRYSLSERVRQSFGKPTQPAEEKEPSEHGTKEEAVAAPPES